MIIKNAAEEIADSMKTVLKGPKLVLSQSEKLTTALQCLNSAAEYFDSAGNDKVAEMVTDILVRFANKV